MSETGISTPYPMDEKQKVSQDTAEFHILIIGWGINLIDNLCYPIQALTGFRFSYILDPALDRSDITYRHDAEQLLCIRDDIRMSMPAPDVAFLASLEQQGVPTIHNMIMGDRVVRFLEYEDALAYASYLARRFEQLFTMLKPAVVIGGFDSLHSSIAMAVARKRGIPWFALNFTTIPKGLAGFCTGMTPDTSIAVRTMSGEALQALAEQTLGAFEEQQLVVPAYLSANSLSMVIKRLPSHVHALFNVVRRIITVRHDRYTQYPLRRLIKDYLRKRINMVRLPTHWFCDAPPEAPFLFIGLHMQPESSIDVWAPFFSDQFSVIESIARSMPPDHHLFVKLHKSDADNYSRRELERLRQMPGVRIVSPFANSRSFIEKAALVMAIQGNIALEAAMLGRPVLVFGDTKFMELPSVSKVNRITDLPMQIRSKLSEAPPTRAAIVRGLVSYLSRYAPGCYNNWEVMPTDEEIKALADQFESLRLYVNRQTPCAE